MWDHKSRQPNTIIIPENYFNKLRYLKINKKETKNFNHENIYSIDGIKVTGSFIFSTKPSVNLTSLTENVAVY